MLLKKKLYSLVPKKHRRKIKFIYYGKILHFLYNLKHQFYYNQKDFFDVIALETTTYCNLRCKFCPNSIYDRGILKNKKLMDIKIFKKIIDELSEINYRGRVLLFSYGEPLTDTRLPDLISYCKQKLSKAKVEINSNGILLTVQKYKTLIDREIDKVCITQYGKQMPPNTKKVFEYLKTRPKKENKIHYRVLNEMELSNRGGEIELNSSVNDEVPICLYPTQALTIDYAGNLILCCNDYHSSAKFGNLKNKKLLEILGKSNYKKILKRIKKGIYDLEICKKCVGIKR